MVNILAKEFAYAHTIVCADLIQAKTLYIYTVLTFCLWFAIKFFTCFAPATVNILAKNFLMEALFTCAPVLQDGARERKC